MGQAFVLNISLLIQVVRLQADRIYNGSNWDYSRTSPSDELTDYVINPFLDLDGQPLVNGRESSQRAEKSERSACKKFSPNPAAINEACQRSPFCESARNSLIPNSSNNNPPPLCARKKVRQRVEQVGPTYTALWGQFFATRCNPQMTGRRGWRANLTSDFITAEIKYANTNTNTQIQIWNPQTTGRHGLQTTAEIASSPDQRVPGYLFNRI